MRHQEEPGDTRAAPGIEYEKPALSPGPWAGRLLESAFDAMLIVDGDATITGANRPACRLLGRALDDVLGRRIGDFIDEPRRIEGDELAYCLTRHDASRLDVMVRQCEGASPREQVWLLREVARETALQAALERQSRLLTEAQEVGRTGAWELDLETGILRWTLGLRRLLEVPDTTKTMSIEETFNYYSTSSEKIVREAFDATLTRGVPYDLELEAVTARGNRLWVREVCRARYRKGRLVSVIGVLQDITERRNLSEYLARITDEERARLGADLHDGLGQELTGLALLLNALATRSQYETPSLSAELLNMSQLASTAVASVRDIAHGMLPIALRHGDLKSAIQSFAKSTRRTFGVRVTTRYRSDNARYTMERTAEQLYRIAQEAVTNAIKHGRARNISIVVLADFDRTSLWVSDDGIGFDGHATAGGMGLQIMHHRARMLGGLIDIQPSKPGGTLVTAVVPTPVSEPRAAAASSRIRGRTPVGR